MKAFQEKPLSLTDLDFKGKNVFVRVDFNVPLKDGKILDTRRVDKVIPSLRYILEKGGRVVLGSHLGRPTIGKEHLISSDNSHLSIRPVGDYLSEKYGLEVFFMERPESEAPRALLRGLKNQQVILLENLRFHPGEINCDRDFAEKLASYTDIYINEGFGISHRRHATVILLPELVPLKGMGFLFQQEIDQIKNLLTVKRKPFYVFLGGSKSDDKIPLLESLLSRADGFFIGGVPAYIFLKAKGVDIDFPVQKSLLLRVSDFIRRAALQEKKIYLPVDHIIARDLTPLREMKTTQDESIPKGFKGVDIGPKTLELFVKELKKCKTLFWNGPMGFFESKETCIGTRQLAQAIACHKKAYRVVGGGHSTLAVRDFEEEIDHVSTGGGASLQYLREGKLPGLQSLLSTHF